MHKATMAYIQTGVTTQGQGEILLMLYDGAIKFLNASKERMAANDMAGKGNKISKALDIIDELKNSLNLEKGGAIAENLRNLYTFCYNRLVSANIKKSPEMVDEVIKVLTGLRNAFESIVDLPEAREAAEQNAAAQKKKAVSQSHTVVASTTGTAAAQGPMAPGASAKLRGIYAQNNRQFTTVGPAVQEQAETVVPAQNQAPEVPNEQPAAGREASAPDLPVPNMSAKDTPHADNEPAVDDTREDAFTPPPLSRFGSGRQGFNRYQKFS